VNRERFEELAHGLALGELGSAEEQEFFALLPQATAAERQGLSKIFDASALATMGMPLELPPASLKDRVLGSILARRPEATSFKYISGNDAKDWTALPVKGAFVKPLSMDAAKGYAVVLGKLEPGASYPPHRHTGPEEVYVISGDLTINGTRLKAGDFHHAESGSEHGVNYSEGGCMVLVVMTIQDMRAAYARTAVSA
jgi:quercetin dioxygenase-like cupin family protein